MPRPAAGAAHAIYLSSLCTLRAACRELAVVLAVESALARVAGSLVMSKACVDNRFAVYTLRVQ